MTNADLIRGMTVNSLAMFLFKFEVVTSSKAMEMKFNELLNAKDMIGWLESEDNTIINQLMSSDWENTDIDFSKFIKE